MSYLVLLALANKTLSNKGTARSEQKGSKNENYGSAFVYTASGEDEIRKRLKIYNMLTTNEDNGDLSLGVAADLDFLAECALEGIYFAKPNGQYKNIGDEKLKVDSTYVEKDKKRSALIYKINSAKSTFNKFVKKVRLFYPDFIKSNYFKKINREDALKYQECRHDFYYIAEDCLDVGEYEYYYTEATLPTADSAFKYIRSEELKRQDRLSKLIDSKKFQEAVIIGKKYILSELKIFLEEVEKSKDQQKLSASELKDVVNLAIQLIKTLEDDIIRLSNLEDEYLSPKNNI